LHGKANPKRNKRLAGDIALSRSNRPIKKSCPVGAGLRVKKYTKIGEYDWQGNLLKQEEPHRIMKTAVIVKKGKGGMYA
jgi:hypothetical protein